MPNPIPTASRTKVKARDEARCVRCSSPGSEWHHRRSRSVKDEHQHCPCNGILLCNTCHRWVHANPFDARRYGWIVSRTIATPFREPVYTPGTGWRFANCDGVWIDPIKAIQREDDSTVTEHEYDIIVAPIPGSPRTGFYIVREGDEEWEDGPHESYAAAEERLGEIIAEAD